MATKAMNFKMDEREIAEMKAVASVYHMTLTDLMKEAISEYVEKLKEDPFYRLTANVMDAGEKESREILKEINSLSDDDLSIASVETVTL